jgi:ATP-dependent Zn protease
LRIQ